MSKETKMLVNVAGTVCALYALGVALSLVGLGECGEMIAPDKVVHFIFSFILGLVWLPLALFLNATKELLDLGAGMGTPEFMDIAWGVMGGIVGRYFRTTHQQELQRKGIGYEPENY